MAWTGMTVFLALTLQRVLEFSASGPSLALLPIAAEGLLRTTLAGRLVAHVGRWTLMVTGSALYAGGLALMALIDESTGYWPQIFAATVLAVTGISVAFVAAYVSALADAADHEHSLVGGLFNIAVQVGGGVGLAVLGALAAARSAPGAAGAQLLPGYQLAFWAACATVVVGMLVALLHRASPASDE